MIASPNRDRLRSIPVWIVSFAAGVSVIFSPFWSGLLVGEFTPTCLSAPRLESDTSCNPDNRPLMFAAVLLFVVQCACIYLIVRTTVRVLRAEASQGSLAACAALALSPMGLAALFTTSSTFVTSSSFWLALGLCLGAAAVAVAGSLVRWIPLQAALMGPCLLLLILATIEVFAVIPATGLAGGVVLAWAAAHFPVSGPDELRVPKPGFADGDRCGCGVLSRECLSNQGK